MRYLNKQFAIKWVTAEMMLRKYKVTLSTDEEMKLDVNPIHVSVKKTTTQTFSHF